MHVTATSDTPSVEFRGVSKSYEAGRLAVRDVSFSLPVGATTALLGASGCGKTTTLRLIAGLEMPDAGEIWLDGICVAGPRTFVPPERRRIGMVFQDYALFPHMSVAENVAFPLNHVPAAERPRRVDAQLALVGLEAFAKRFPHELSGGQQQRVALARALVARPSLVLLDEPFSNLDAALRRSMREEVRRILRTAGVTGLFVTHDQEEALSLADRIAVMRLGEMVQIGTPHDVYLRPATREVAHFLGEANMLPAEAYGEVAVSVLGPARLMNRVNGQVDLMVRPEGMRLLPTATGQGVIEKIAYYGHDQMADVRLVSGELLRIRMRPQPGVAAGQPVALEFRGPVLAFAK